jgi:hypothetical protein
MNDMERLLLAMALDMDEMELRAALIGVIRGWPLLQSMEAAYSPLKAKRNKYVSQLLEKIE